MIVPTIEDAERFHLLMTETFIESHRETNWMVDIQCYLREHLTLDHVRTAITNANLIGFEHYGTLMAYVEFYPQKKNCIIKRFFVSKLYQRRGYGTTIMTTLETITALKNIEIITLGVWRHNIAAIKFYSKFGFEHVSQQPFRMGRYNHIDWVMKKSIKY